MPDFLTLMADFFLLMGHPVTVAALFLVGFITHDKTTWGIAIMLAGFSMMLNPALKEIFQLPRPQDITEYGFPSGHFQGSMCFYGWLALRIPNKWIRGGLALLLAGIGFALVYKGFHYARDIAGSFVVGSIIIFSTQALLRREPFHGTPPLLGCVFSGIGIIPLVYMSFHSGIQKHSLVGLVSILAVMMIWMRFFPEKEWTGQQG
jgi:membrane-associated phospholipid phosphatase